MRRARRLLPAALVFVFVLIAAAQAFFPGDVRALRGVALAAIGYLTNWFLVFSDQPYFETIGRPQLLQHLWSLAVEEQFYLIWPPLLLVMLRVGRRQGAFALTVLLGLASVVLMAMLYRGGSDVSRLYYGTDTHAVGLLAGAALAFAEPLWRARDGRRALIAYQCAGGVALTTTSFLFAWLAEWRPFLYQGGFALAALVSVVLILAMTMPGPLTRTLGSAPFRWIGLRSYSVYLWHPAMIALIGAAGLTLPRPALAVVAAALTVLVADLSYRFVETPVRTGGLQRSVEAFRALRGDTRWALGVAGVTASIAVIFGAAFAPPPAAPDYLAVPQINAILTAHNVRPDPTVSAPSWVVPREAFGTSQAEPVSRSGVPVRTPTAGLTVRSLSAVVTATPPAGAGNDGISITPVPPPSMPGAPGTPTPTSTPASAAGTANVLAIGDSVMLGAANDLARAFGTIEVDAAIGRDAATTLRLLHDRRASNRLPDTVIVQIGNNGPLTRPQMNDLMSLLSGVNRAIIIDLRVPQPWEGPNNTVLADAVARFSNARLVAWHVASGARQDLFWDDMHLRPEGAQLYVALIAAQAA